MTTPPLPLQPVGPKLLDNNRRLLAERQHWPDGVLDECQRIDHLNPGWDTMWSAGGELTWKERGFYSTHADLAYGPGPRRYLYGATIEEILDAIADHQPADRWDFHPLTCWTTDR